MQPYIDLVHGNSPPQRSLLLDYTRTKYAHRWKFCDPMLNLTPVTSLSGYQPSGINISWLPSLPWSLLSLLSSSLLGQPCSRSETPGGHTLVRPLVHNYDMCRILIASQPATTVRNLAAVGLNQDADFQDLTCRLFLWPMNNWMINLELMYLAFLSAAGYASSSVLYNLGDQPFMHDVYTIAPFQVCVRFQFFCRYMLMMLQIPTDVATNGTVLANTTGVKSDANCNLATTVCAVCS